ncbi:MAG TPA: hypothetical protein VMF03_16610 [Steroidobacteraceae bacterium]|nr:hypothetical protein [Steroidobacteraceae bacterium]
MGAAIQIVLIAVVFAAQIFVLSFLTPVRRHHFWALMFTRYPPGEYPRLYPIPRERIQRRLAFFRPMHRIIGVGAAIALAVGLIKGVPAWELASWMLYCMVVQILPLYIGLPWSMKLIRAYRAMPPPSVRSAQLRPWRITDFVSPLLICLGLVAITAALACSVLAYRHRPQSLVMVLLCGGASGLLLIQMLRLVVGPLPVVRVDPYMSDADTFRIRQTRFRNSFRGGMIFGLYFALIQLYFTHLIRFDLAYLAIGISLFFQLFGLRITSYQGRDLETRDFSVYRADGNPQPTP